MTKKKQMLCQFLFIFVLFIMPLFLAGCFDKKTKKLLKNNLIEFQLIDGYFLKNNVNLPDDVNCILLDSSKDFENYFSIAKTMNNVIITPDFKKNFIFAVIQKETIKNIDMSIVNIKKYRSALIINFNIAAGNSNSYTSTPCIIFSIPKDDKIKIIDFVQNGISIKKIKR